MGIARAGSNRPQSDQLRLTRWAALNQMGLPFFYVAPLVLAGTAALLVFVPTDRSLMPLARPLDDVPDALGGWQRSPLVHPGPASGPVAQPPLRPMLSFPCSFRPVRLAGTTR